jgi:acyl-CoA thioester hydrolase
MKAVAVEYDASARFDDLLEVFIRTTRIGRTSVTAECAAYRAADDVLLCTATETLVLVDSETRRPTAVPERYRAVIGAFEGPGLEGGIGG